MEKKLRSRFLKIFERSPSPLPYLPITALTAAVWLRPWFGRRRVGDGAERLRGFPAQVTLALGCVPQLFALN